MNTINNELGLIRSLYSEKRVSGLTHNFYRYPARFSPEFAREAILQFSNENDYILDAFMGSGTTIVEALANGRYAFGVDINPLSCFITKVKTTPLSARDKDKILEWVAGINFDQSFDEVSLENVDGLNNIPDDFKKILIDLNKSIATFEFPRQKNFAKCALVRFGQWAIDCRKELPHVNVLKAQLSKQVIEMLEGLDGFVFASQRQGISKNQITNRRKLYQGSLDELVHNQDFAKMRSKVRLVLTSPPYPGVHVLYHRWQVNSRKETPAPYWLAGLQNGHGEAYYTLGGRSLLGNKNYFIRLKEIFDSIRLLIHPDATVAQLVAFSNPDAQLPTFLEAMQSAGFEEITPFSTLNAQRLDRLVPNRRWYTNIDTNRRANKEMLLLHKPIQ